MIRTVWIALAACLLTAPPASAQAAPADARHQIEPLLDEMVAAANAHDTDRFMKVYLHQPSLVFVFNGTIFRGFDALHEQQLKWWNNGASDVAYTQRGAPVISISSGARLSRRPCPVIVSTSVLGAAPSRRGRDFSFPRSSGTTSLWAFLAITARPYRRP
mgnify:CR=1 FL=1